MSKSLVESLPPEVKAWCARAVAGMIVADGNVTDSEIEFLKETISFLEDIQVIHEIVDFVKRKDKMVLQVLRAEPKAAAHILMYVASLAMSDSKLDDAEVEYFNYVGRKLGFGTEYSAEIMTWSRDYHRMIQKQKSLIKKADVAHGKTV